jgi:hypothetical protein
MYAPESLERAILHTLAYADVFDYPLTANEIHHYLTRLRAPLERVDGALRASSLWNSVDGFYCLRGREALGELRRRREGVARRLWPPAVRYGRLLASLPFVRMVAATGSLAVNNAEEWNDIDYLIVTAPGRLWTCRALALLVTRLARLQRVRICPNYLVTDTNLELSDHSLYVARELAQMVPLAGLPVYERMRRLNSWTDEYLPNAGGLPHLPVGVRPTRSRPVAQRLLEALMNIAPAHWFEAWEMRRKIERLSREQAGSPEAWFSPDQCKGHGSRHGQRAERAFRARLEELSLELPA